MPSVHGQRLRILPCQLQAVLTTTKSGPTSGAKYTLIDTTRNIRVHGISLVVVWTGAPSSLELHGTIDGETWKWDVSNPASTTYYYAGLNANRTIIAQYLLATQPDRAFLFDARSCKLEMEVTGGTVTTLEGRMIYSLW